MRRGISIWIDFHTPGEEHGGDTGDVADDHYNRYKEDISLMSELGLTTYRFSIAWPRIFPEGTGAQNPKGFDFYDRMVDSLLEAKIAPYCTLYHWDLPQELQYKGGWQNRDTANAFADYAAVVTEHLSDRVKYFMTVNELSTYVNLGYRDGTHAPGLKLDERAGPGCALCRLGPWVGCRGDSRTCPAGNQGWVCGQSVGCDARHRDAGAH